MNPLRSTQQIAALMDQIQSANPTAHLEYESNRAYSEGTPPTHRGTVRGKRLTLDAVGSLADRQLKLTGMESKRSGASTVVTLSLQPIKADPDLIVVDDATEFADFKKAFDTAIDPALLGR